MPGGRPHQAFLLGHRDGSLSLAEHISVVLHGVCQSMCLNSAQASPRQETTGYPTEAPYTWTTPWVSPLMHHLQCADG